MNADEVIQERLNLLRNEIAYLRSEREKLSTFQDYQSDPRVKGYLQDDLAL